MLIAAVLLLLFFMRGVLSIWLPLGQITYNGDISTRGNECNFLDLGKKTPSNSSNECWGDWNGDKHKPVPNVSLEFNAIPFYLATTLPFALK